MEFFFISAVASILNVFMRPAWFVMRSHMGIQHTALLPLICSAVGFCACLPVLLWAGQINQEIILFYLVIFIAGYLRNAAQARRRRKQRNWDVSTWSTGESLLEPVLAFTARRVLRRWGNHPLVYQTVTTALSDDFIYYVAEPVVLLLASAALWLVGSGLFFYPIILAVGCVVVRNDAQLFLYLKAHEIPDGKRFERAIKYELDGPAHLGGHDIQVANIVGPASAPLADDGKRVFDRLSPELQELLTKDLPVEADVKRTRISKSVTNANRP